MTSSFHKIRLYMTNQKYLFFQYLSGASMLLHAVQHKSALVLNEYQAYESGSYNAIFTKHFILRRGNLHQRCFEKTNNSINPTHSCYTAFKC